MNQHIRLALFATLAFAFAFGCTGRDLEQYDQDTTWTRMLRAHAAEMWTAAGVSTPDDYILAVLPPDDLRDVCEVPDGEEVGGCSFHDDGAVFVEASTPERMRTVVTHELGHLVGSRHAGHLPCNAPGEAVMCTGGSGWVTARDAAFVRGEP